MIAHDGSNRHRRDLQYGRRIRRGVRPEHEGRRALQGSRHPVRQGELAGDQRAGLVGEGRGRAGSLFSQRRPGAEDRQGTGAFHQESRRQLHPGRRPASRSDLGNVRQTQQARHDSPQRFVRALPAHRTRERTLRSRPVAQQPGGQLLQDRPSDSRGDREGAREYARQASQDALRECALRDAVLRHGQSRRAARQVSRMPTSNSPRPCRTWAARRA